MCKEGHTSANLCFPSAIHRNLESEFLKPMPVIDIFFPHIFNFMYLFLVKHFGFLVVCFQVSPQCGRTFDVKTSSIVSADAVDIAEAFVDRI